MNGKRAKDLREGARNINGGGWSSFERTQHRPKPIIDARGYLVGQLDRYTDRCEGYRRVYQDLKKARGLRRSGTRELTELEAEKGREVLEREAERRERADRRAERKQARRKAWLKIAEEILDGEERRLTKAEVARAREMLEAR